MNNGGQPSRGGYKDIVERMTEVADGVYSRANMGTSFPDALDLLAEAAKEIRRLRNIIAGGERVANGQGAFIPESLAFAANHVEELPWGPFLKLHGVYFLILGEQVVYVGKTTNFLVRLGCHIQEKAFDRVLVLPVHKYGDLHTIEGAFIRRLKPPLNSLPNPAAGGARYEIDIEAWLEGNVPCLAN